MPKASRSRALANRLKWVMWGTESGQGGAFNDQPNSHPVVGDQDQGRQVEPRFVARIEWLGVEARSLGLLAARWDCMSPTASGTLSVLTRSGRRWCTPRPTSWRAFTIRGGRRSRWRTTNEPSVL